MMDLWKQLKEYLKVQMIPASSQPKESASRLRLRFTVTNTAPSPSLEIPEIVFKDVVLKTNSLLGNSSSSRNLGTLEPGGSVDYECELSYAETVEMTYELEASVSPEAFFRLRSKGGPSGDVMQLPITAYSQVFNETQVHRWLETVIKPFPIPGPKSTLEELDSLRGRLNAAVIQAREAESRLAKIANGIRRGHEREAALEHGSRVNIYLESIVRGLAEIREAMKIADAQRIRKIVEIVSRRLEREAERINEATDRLMDQVGGQVRSQRAQLRTEPKQLGVESRQPAEEQGDDEGNGSLGRSPNDDRSDSMNPNNPAYWASRGGG